MKNQFAPYDIALQVKELGFDKPCFGKFIDEGFHAHQTGWVPQIKLVPETQYSHERPIRFGQENNPYATNKMDNIILAPLWEQVVDWLLNEKHYFLIPKYDMVINNDDIEYNFYYHLRKTEGATIIETPKCFMQGQVGKNIDLVFLKREALRRAIETALLILKK